MMLNIKKEGKRIMPIINYLERNASLYGDDTALIEVNPEQKEPGRITWKDYELI